MSNYYQRGGHGAGNSSFRPHPVQDRDDFYDDHRSRSNSPEYRYDSRHDRRSPPHDISRAPRGPRQDRHYDNHGSRSPDRRRDRSRDRKVYYDEHRSPSPGRGRGYYDRDRPRTHSRRRSRSRSVDSERAPSRGRASKEIMMEGLAPHLTEHDISAELKQHYRVNELDDVRIIRDRQTRQSREFGFLRFASLEDAQDFMDRNYPTIYLYGDSSKGSGRADKAKVRITYSRERKENRIEEGDWTCAVCNINNYSTRVRCFRCQTAKSGLSKASNIGDNDAAPDNVPSQFLLFRGLEISVTEELFVKGVAKLNKPANSSGQSNLPTSKKGAKVASTTGDANLGAKEGTLRRVFLVRDRQNNESWRYGFAEYATIEDAQAALTRYNSFDRFTIASKQVLVSYIHAGVFIPALNVTPENTKFTFSPLGNPSVHLSYWVETAYVSELVVSEPDPPTLNDAVPTGKAVLGDIESAMKSKEAERMKKRKANADSVAGGTKKATPSHLQFWSNRHAELHGLEKKKSSQNGSEAGDDNGQPPNQSYADPERNCCYLCMRQFTSSAEVNRHERLSELHRKNLQDPAKIKKAAGKLEKHGVQQQAQQTEYRDRARERRKIYGVINKKGEHVGSKTKAASASSDEESAAPVPSKGASLLSKMGYTAGQGLGASGEGMTAPITQNLYVAGVGLGAQGGKLGDAVSEAEKNTKSDYGTFVESVKQQAKDRYARMAEG